MAFALREGVSFCSIGDRRIFLDLPADRYFCLPPEAEALFAQLLRSDAGTPGDAALAFLEALGLGTAQPGAQPPQACDAHAPKLAFADFARAGLRSTCADRMDARIAIFRARLALRLRPLHRILGALAARRTGLENSPRDIERAGPVLAAFEALGRTTAADGDCLLRTVSLAAALIDADVRPTIVLGVRLDPFTAHSWVQIGPLLIYDTLERVGVYTPILAL